MSFAYADVRNISASVEAAMYHPWALSIVALSISGYDEPEPIGRGDAA